MLYINSSTDVMEVGKNTLWMVGDSFTAGDGTFVCKHDNYPNKKNIPFFGDSIAQKLDMKLINRGKSGASNDQIFDRLLSVVHEAKEGDFILTGQTFPMRTQLFIPGANTVESEKFIEWSFRSTPSELDQVIIGNSNVRIEHYPNLVSGSYDVEKLARYDRSIQQLFDDTISYIVNVREQQGQFIDKYVVEKYNLLHDLATQKGVGTLLWYQARLIQEVNIQSIWEDTGGDIEDAHFSFKGQHTLGKTLIRLIETKYGKITRNKNRRLHPNWTI